MTEAGTTATGAAGAGLHSTGRAGSQSPAASVLRSALWLTAAVAAGWVVCFWPARMLRGADGVQWMSVAAICCLVPGWFVVFLSGLAIVRSELSAMLLQTGIRLFSVSAAALAVRQWRPTLGVVDFFGWLIGFYLLTLVVEVRMLRQRLPQSGSAGSHS